MQVKQSNFHLEFSKTQPLLSKPPYSIRQKTYRKVAGSILSAITRTLTRKRENSDWTRDYQMIVYGVRGVIDSLAIGDTPDFRIAQKLSEIPSPIPSDGKIIDHEGFTASPLVIEFLKTKVKDWPDSAGVADHVVNAEFVMYEDRKNKRFNGKVDTEPVGMDKINFESTTGIFNRASLVQGHLNSEDKSKEVTDANIESAKGKIIYQLHGGAYAFGSEKFYRRHAYFASKVSSGVKVFTIRYRKAPYYSYPCALIDAVSGYLELLKLYPGKDIIFMGDSAGGGLALCALLLIRDMKLEMPSGAFLQSPWVDLTMSSESFQKNILDCLPEIPRDSRLLSYDRKFYYSSNADMINPYVSPVFAESFEGICPILLQVGSIEKLYDECMSVTNKIKATGTSSITTHIFANHVHCHQQFHFPRASKVAMLTAGDWMRSCWAGNVKVGKNELIKSDFSGVELSRESL